MKKQTHSDYLLLLKQNQPDLFDKIEIISEIKSCNCQVDIKTKYGLNKVYFNHLLRGTPPTRLSAINKSEYYTEELKEKNILVFNEIIGDISYSNRYVTFDTKYGKCKTFASSLYVSKGIDIQSAVNKTEYWVNMVKEVHGDRYDYSLVKYTKATKKIKIICKQHGLFEQTPIGHLCGKGCRKCANIEISIKNIENSSGWTYTKWEKSSKISKNFDSYKVYIIKCWNADKSEVFYKIGKTFMTIKKRFNTKTALPYNYEILKVIEGDCLYICELEVKLKNMHKQYRYIPSLKFKGSSECFTFVNTYLPRELLYN